MRNRIMARLAQNSTNRYPALAMKLKKSTTPMEATIAVTTPMATIEM